MAQAEFKARVHRFKTILYPTSAWVFMTTNSIYRRGAILFVPEILPLCRYNKAVLLRVCMYRWGNRSRMLSRELPGLLVCSACLINAGFVTVFELSEKCIFCFLELSVSRIYTLLWLCRTFRSLFIMQKSRHISDMVSALALLKERALAVASCLCAQK